jgi:catechol 2,3-dioxygenase-like lactoylglutathione lyase family enzyme
MPALSALTILVPDLPAARGFYCDVLGFTVETSYGPALVKLQHPGCALMLSQCERPAQPDYPATAQVVLGLAVADIEQELKRLQAAQVKLLFTEPQPFPAGRFLALRDPAGNVVELLKFLG